MLGNTELLLRKEDSIFYGTDERVGWNFPAKRKFIIYYLAMYMMQGQNFNWNAHLSKFLVQYFSLSRNFHDKSLDFRFSHCFD